MIDLILNICYIFYTPDVITTVYTQVTISTKRNRVLAFTTKNLTEDDWTIAYTLFGILALHILLNLIFVIKGMVGGDSKNRIKWTCHSNPCSEMKFYNIASVLLSYTGFM